MFAGKDICQLEKAETNYCKHLERKRRDFANPAVPHKKLSIELINTRSEYGRM
jgi:hypothetical protein